jgi:acetylglutamate kinase
MKIEDLKIEDNADANYFIKKFFNNDYSKIPMTQLEQLVLTVYAMGKKNGVSTASAQDENEPKSAGKAPAKANAIKLNERVKTLEDVEIGHSGEFIKTNSEGSVTLIKGDIITVLFEVGEEGEMMEVNIPLDKLKKVG